MSKNAALIACDGQGNGCLLAWTGIDISAEVEGLSRRLDELGLDDAPEGISIWEGRYINAGYGKPEDAETVPDGVFRELTTDEWSRVAAKQPPWADEQISEG